MTGKVKYIRVTFDSKLNFDKHLDAVTKSQKRLGLAGDFFGKEWGIPSQKTHWIYIGMYGLYGGIGPNWKAAWQNLITFKDRLSRNHRSSGSADSPPIHLVIRTKALRKVYRLKKTCTVIALPKDIWHYLRNWISIIHSAWQLTE